MDKLILKLCTYNFSRICLIPWVNLIDAGRDGRLQFEIVVKMFSTWNLLLPLQSLGWTHVGPGSQLDWMHWTRYFAPQALRSSCLCCEAPGRHWR